MIEPGKNEYSVAVFLALSKTVDTTNHKIIRKITPIEMIYVDLR